jgi:hypothetical protein
MSRFGDLLIRSSCKSNSADCRIRVCKSLAVNSSIIRPTARSRKDSSHVMPRLISSDSPAGELRTTSTDGDRAILSVSPEPRRSSRSRTLSPRRPRPLAVISKFHSSPAVIRSFLPALACRAARRLGRTELKVNCHRLVALIRRDARCYRRVARRRQLRVRQCNILARRLLGRVALVSLRPLQFRFGILCLRVLGLVIAPVGPVTHVLVSGCTRILSRVTVRCVLCLVVFVARLCAAAIATQLCSDEAHTPGRTKQSYRPPARSWRHFIGRPPIQRDRAGWM